MIKLSIIIPAYNAGNYLELLLTELEQQVTEEVEVIVIDDGSRVPVPDHPFTKTIRQQNKGVSAARNRGLEEATGQYVAFIDADDLVSPDYIEIILDKIKKEHFDYMYLSWKTIGDGWKYRVELKSIEDKFPPFNLCVWNRVYRRSMIKGIRFNEKKAIAEDAEFIRAFKEDGKKKAFCPEPVYWYRADTPNSLTKRFQKGELDFERIVYYFKHITPNDTWLIQDIQARDPSDKEIIVMTEKNDLPELENYAMVTKPVPISGSLLVGERWDKFRKISRPIKTQIVLYIGNSQTIGGIETFLYNFCKVMCIYYDIMVVFSDHMDAKQIIRLSEYVMVMRECGKNISCDTVIVIRIGDKVPPNIGYKKKIQMVHTCHMGKWKIQPGYDELIFVSQVAADSFKDQVGTGHKIIHNISDEEMPKEALILVSAQRMSYEKGEKRIIELANQFRNKGIPFLWLVFTAEPLSVRLPGLICVPPTLDVRAYIAKADYYVSLSDIEAYGYSMREALEMGVPILTTPIDVLPEIGFVEGQNGWTVPFDVTKADVEKYYNKIPRCGALEPDNDEIVKQWKEVLGEERPSGAYRQQGDLVKVQITQGYGDMELGRNMMPGEVVKMRRERAMVIIGRGFGEWVES